MEEIWKTIPNFSSYSVSTFGRVFSAKTGIMNGSNGTTKMNYRRVTLVDDFGNKKCKNIHRLVLETFTEVEDRWALHKDGNASNNRLENLYWGNPVMNGSDRVSHGNSGKNEKKS